MGAGAMSAYLIDMWMQCGAEEKPLGALGPTAPALPATTTGCSLRGGWLGVARHTGSIQRGASETTVQKRAEDVLELLPAIKES